ncbi:hypothetical protein [Phytohabitans kaempferiae]
MVEFKMAFPVSGDMSGVRLSSGRGYSFHYDFYNAWDTAPLAALVRHCINAGRQCDAGRRRGAGRVLLGPRQPPGPGPDRLDRDHVRYRRR